MKHKAHAGLLGEYPTIYAVFIEINGKAWVDTKNLFDTKEEAEAYIVSQPDLELEA